MLIVAPLAVFLLLCFVCALIEPQCSARRIFLTSSVAWGVIVAVITELLSLLNALTSTWVVISWTLVLLTLAVGVSLAMRWRRKSLLLIRQRVISFWDNVAGDASPLWALAALPQTLMVFGLIAILLLTALNAVGAAPNNWDSMTFHLARVMYWVQQGSLAPYPTDIMRQLYEAPWAEYAITQLYLLWGSDVFSASVQWWSMLGSVIGVSLIAEQLGAPKLGQLFAAVFMATVPMGILQATSTQNDYVTTFWFVCFIHFTLAFRQRPSSYWNIGGLGASMGLAMLTKATTYVYAAPLLVLLAYWAIRKLRWRVWEPALLASVLAFTLNVGYYIRNLNAFGSVFGPPSETSNYANQQFGVGTLVANVIRDSALQIGTPWNFVNTAIDGVVRWLFSALSMNISDPATSWAPWAFNALSLHEDYAGNPLQTLLIVAVVVALLVSAQLRANRLALAYGGATILSYLVFAGYLKWQPWNSRLELVFFALFAPLCGLALSQLPLMRLSPRVSLTACGLLLIFASTPWVVANKSRPLIGSNNIITTPRVDQYFTNRPALEAPYVGAANYIAQRHCSAIGLIDNIDDWEYPWWEVFEQAYTPVTIEHIDVTNDTAHLVQPPPYATYQPCAIIVSNHSAFPATVTYQGMNYDLTWQSSPIKVYVP